MTSKHTDPEWRATVRHVRARVRAAWWRGDEVSCWRCGRVIPEDMPYDVGHLDRLGGNGVDNAAPEHRTKTGPCIGNRNHGGRIGAAMTNAKKPGAKFQAPPWV